MKEELKRNIGIKLGNEQIEIELVWDQAPNLCSKLWSKLPVESFVTHAKICSNEIIFMLPFVIEGENMQIPKIGDVGWWTKRSCVNIWYNDAGPLGPLGPTALFGRVIRNLEGVEREGKRVWSKPGGRIELFRVIQG